MSSNTQESPAQTTPPLLEAAFPIVGIGASAGGLEALELFLEKMPSAPGMAFVIVQHLAPNHKQMLREILTPLTTMPVKEITDGMPVKKNTIYIIPPNKDLSIHKRILYLLDPVDPKGLRLPINTFFKSLALDLEEKSIGVILSGMGRDGTDGLKAIKEKAGICFIQNPASAKFDSMPQNAIKSGLADVVADPGELATTLISYSKNLPLQTLLSESGDESQARDLQKIILLLFRHSGQDFSDYKVNTLLRRIERRMGLHQLHSMKRYIHFLQETPQELDLLLSELLIGVTEFFRDPLMWEALSKQVFPDWFQKEPAGRCFRIWVPACSTGEEAYSVAILYNEALEKYSPQGKFSLQIFATDLNQVAIDNAREGLFTAEAVSHLPKDLVKKYFTLTPHDTYRVNKSIRECVIFARQNVLMDPPFTKIDLLVCRNLLIYLTSPAQEKLFPLFHFSLNQKGYLFLGSAETTGSQSFLFNPLDKKSRIFQKVACDLKSDQLDFPAFMRSAKPIQQPTVHMTKADSLQALTEKMILNQVSPPSVLVNAQGDIVYISGRTGKFLEPAVGKANWNIFAMIHKALQHPLESGFEECLRLKKPTVRKKLWIKSPGNDVHIDLELNPVNEPEALAGMILIVFKEVEALSLPPLEEEPLSDVDRSRVKVLEEELLRIRSELQHTREETQSSQEESRSVNEELQSINEELTTSREEIQSMNEELQTLNAELQRKVDDLSLLNNDLNNILNRTEIATLFLDADLNIRLFTAGVTKILNLIPGDVGRHISDIALKLNYPKLTEDIGEVLKTLVFHDEEASNVEGNWYSVRILPYRTVYNLIDGAVITFTDITASKTLETHLRDKLAETHSPPTP